MNDQDNPYASPAEQSKRQVDWTWLAAQSFVVAIWVIVLVGSVALMCLGCVMLNRGYAAWWFIECIGIAATWVSIGMLCDLTGALR